MKNKFISAALLITLLVCLVGCKSDDACPLHIAANNGGGTGGSISKIYNALGAHPTLGPYESFTLNPDGTAEYLLYLVGLGWTKAVGTYSIDQSTNNRVLLSASVVFPLYRLFLMLRLMLIH